MKRICPVFFTLILLSSILWASEPTVLTQQPAERVTVPGSTVLRVALAARTPIGHVGRQVEAVVVQPVYVFDRMVIPADSKVRGRITALHAAAREERIVAMTGGDFTPFKDPEILFDELILPDGSVLPINTAAVKRNSEVVELRDPKAKGDSLLSEGRHKLRETLGRAGGPGILDRIRNAAYGYLPYHPQSIDRGSLFDAVLLDPLPVSVPVEEIDRSHLGECIPPGALAHARLLTDLSSFESKEGMPIQAVLTEPIWGSDHELLYPEGTELLGNVIRARPAGSLGRCGELRFAFRSIRLPAGSETEIQSQVEAVEAQRGANMTIDAEGGTRARPGNRFLAPLFAAGMAATATKDRKSRIKRAVVSHGFSLVGRIAGTAGPENMATGISYYGLARSVYLRFLRRGPEVVFPKNTRLDIRLIERP